jgi:hypothetical protein
MNLIIKNKAIATGTRRNKDRVERPVFNCSACADVFIPVCSIIGRHLVINL